MRKPIKQGGMVQVWDWVENDMQHHGRVGYAVKKERDRTGSLCGGDLWKVVFFDGDNHQFCFINEDWLSAIHDINDIMKVKSDGL